MAPEEEYELQKAAYDKAVNTRKTIGITRDAIDGVNLNGLPGLPGRPGGREWGELVPLGALPPAPEFPLSVFPVELACFAGELAEALYCPPDFIGLSMLAAVSGAVGASRALQVKNGWTERGAIYSGVINPPGHTKSAAVEQAVQPITEIDLRNYRLH